MTRGQVIVATVGGLALAAAAGSWALDGHATARAACSGLALRAGLTIGETSHGQAPQSGWEGQLHPRHGLYRRHDGHGMRAVLAAPGGWDWFSDPPSEATL